MKTEATDRPLVSVSIPSYNGEEFIEESIESVLKQTFTDFELLICDDASSDRTPEILEKYKQSDSRVSVFKFTENLGLAGNWNRGLKKARGKYIKMLCQDDLLAPEYLEEAVNVLESHASVSLVCSFEKTIGKLNKTRSFDVFPGSGELKGGWVQDHIVKRGNWIGAPSATLFRKEDLSKIGLFDEKLPCSLDWEMWLRFLGHGNIFVIPKFLYSTRIHPNQETSNCIRNMGFLKDRISIIHKVRNQPELYGRKEWEIPGQIHKRAVNLLLQAAAGKKPSQTLDAIRFLNQFQSPVSSWASAAKVFLQGPVKSLRSTINGRNS